MEGALGRKVNKAELNSLSAWMEVAEAEQLGDGKKRD